MTKFLREWLDYLEEEAVAYSCLSDELSKLLQPYVVVHPSQNHPDIPGEGGPTQPPEPAPPEDDGILTDVKRGLERANRARQRAVKNLLPEVELCQSDAVGEREVDPINDGFSVVAESVLRDLIAKHSITEDSIDRTVHTAKLGSSKESRSLNRRQQNGDKPSVRPGTDGKKSVARPGTVNRKPVSALRRPPNSKKTNMYQTSSSVIGDGLKKIQRGKNVRSAGSTVQKTMSTSRVEQRGDPGTAAVNKPRSFRKAHQKEDLRKSYQNTEQIKMRNHAASPGAIQISGGHSSDRDIPQQGITAEIPGVCDDNRVDSDRHGQHSGSTDDKSSKLPSSGSKNGQELMFDLVRDGKNIEIPGKLKKLISSNRKWKSRIMKKSTSSHSSAFMERLNAPLTTEMNAMEIDRLYDYYSAEISEVNQEIASLERNGNLSPAQVDMFNSRLSEIKSEVECLDHLRRTKLCVSDEVTPSVLTTNSGSPLSLEYTTLKQLETYTDLQLRAGLLEYTQKLEQELTVHLLSLIRRHREELSCRSYRRIEGLLSHGAELFPSMVRCSDEHTEDSSGEPS